MLIIKQATFMSGDQICHTIYGARNPMNSWDRMDSGYVQGSVWDEEPWFELGDADHALLTTLAKGGPVNAKYRRGLIVKITIIAPLYWWKEFDTYKIGTVSNSCSTMHKIHAKEFTVDDFSHEHLECAVRDEVRSMDILEMTIKNLNFWRDRYIECDRDLKNGGLSPKDRKIRTADRKHAWWQMIQLLPSSYNQMRTIDINYETLHNIYMWRRNHKLDEWRTFCDWIRDVVPYSELITVKDYYTANEVENLLHHLEDAVSSGNIDNVSNVVSRFKIANEIGNEESDENK